MTNSACYDELWSYIVAVSPDVQTYGTPHSVSEASTELAAGRGGGRVRDRDNAGYVGCRSDKFHEAHRRIKHVRNEDDWRWLTGILLHVMGENRQVYRDRRRFIPCYPLYHCATRLLNELAYTLILNESPRAQYKHQPRSRATPHRGPHERTAHLHHGKAAPKAKAPVSAASTRASSDE